VGDRFPDLEFEMSNLKFQISDLKSEMVFASEAPSE